MNFPGLTAIFQSKSFSKIFENTPTSTLTGSVVIEHIVTVKAPLPRGHYAQATRANGLVFVSGQLPLTKDGDSIIAEGLDAQVRQALANVREVLLAAGSDIDQLLSVQIYVSDIEDWPRVNELYREFIGDPAPARTVVPCAELHYGAQVEISAIALCNDDARSNDFAGRRINE
ncbi:MAG TPA: RidA family protein [Paraburkholderia sp.]|nr:RidA family protein [Paraburkholderia sp.]